MTRISKDPAIRRQELIEAAKRLFLTRGYESTSIKDILFIVGGQPGMFYYYFKSKEEIYKTALTQFVDEYVQQTTDILEDTSNSISSRICNALKFTKTCLIQSFIASDDGYAAGNIESSAVISYDFLNRLAEPTAKLILEAQKNEVTKSPFISCENVRSVALFLLYGVYGIINDSHDTALTANVVDGNMKNIYPLLSAIFKISECQIRSENSQAHHE